MPRTILRLALLATVCLLGCTSGSRSAVCGNGVCEEPESALQCDRDCGAGRVCGNGLCETGETAATCETDCFGFVAICGNGICEGTETATTCAADCVLKSAKCGNGACETGETFESCASDCSDPLNVTGAWTLTIETEYNYYYMVTYSLQGTLTLTESNGSVTGSVMFSKGYYNSATISFVDVTRNDTSMTGDVMITIDDTYYSTTYSAPGTIDWTVAATSMTGFLNLTDEYGYPLSLPCTATR